MAAVISVLLGEPRDRGVETADGNIHNTTKLACGERVQNNMRVYPTQGETVVPYVYI